MKINQYLLILININKSWLILIILIKVDES